MGSSVCKCRDESSSSSTSNAILETSTLNGHCIGTNELKQKKPKKLVGKKKTKKTDEASYVNPTHHSSFGQESRPSMGVGMGIGLMMQQAELMAGYVSSPFQADANTLMDMIRKAKAEGRTVTMLNGFLYIDYQLKAQIPPGFLPE